MSLDAGSPTAAAGLPAQRAIDVFDAGARSYPERSCLRWGDDSLSYREVELLSQRIAVGLAAEGFGRGTHAAVLSPNHPHAFLCVLGILRAGAVWMSINARNADEEIVRTLQALDCEILFYHHDFSAMLPQLRAQAPGIRRYICIDRGDGDAPGVLEWAAGFAPSAAAVAVEADDVAILSATGGTTGRPKGVMLTQKNFVAFCDGVDWEFPDDQTPVYLAAAPMTHVGGRFCFPVMRRGGTVVILAKPDSREILAAIPKYRVTRLFLPPTAIYALLAEPCVRTHDFSSLRYFSYGGGPMSVHKLKEAINVFGPVMAQGYGQTEAPLLMAFLSPRDHFEDGRLGAALACDERLSSCGKPTPFARIGIMDDRGHMLPQGEIGEIVVRGEFVMKGYYKDASASAAVSDHGWHHTGDVGRLDADGFLHIVDRKKDMIVTGGFNVFSSEVEQVISTLPGVRDCAVFGVPDDKWGESVKAIVQLELDVQLSESEVIAACRPRLGGVKTPKSVEFRDQLPRNAAGKVLKRLLRDPYWAGRTRKV